ncbi:hypothetical protein J437_LFUL000735 [Ladona fulva]|uniref:Sushi domain-containing protein n=1 Tax=Ladona fulva TaxID=123851 RepID=A0A8K0NU76_LADFU|nr:hypothetical protein J437_LFUL000735 [Ladona fulva]
MVLEEYFSSWKGGNWNRGLERVLKNLIEDEKEYRSEFCEEPRLLNGRVRLRVGGTIAKFNCRQGYYLWGAKYATCILGRWDVEAPICIRE